MDIEQCGQNGRPCRLCVKGKNPWNKDGKISLWCAAEFGCDVNLRRTLAANGNAKVNHRNGSGKTPLCWAASRGFTSTVQVLIGEGGADVDKPASVGCRSFTPLHYAAEKGHTAAVEVLLSHGANLDAPDRSGWTPLHTAAYNCKEGYEGECYHCGHVSTVEKLLEGGATLDIRSAKGRTPLHQAVLFGQTEIVKVLVDRGADRNAKDNEGLTPESTSHWRPEISDILAQADTD